VGTFSRHSVYREVDKIYNFITVTPHYMLRVKQHILKSAITVFYYLTTEISLGVSAMFIYKLRSKCSSFALTHAVSRRCHPSVAMSKCAAPNLCRWLPGAAQVYH